MVVALPSVTTFVPAALNPKIPFEFVAVAELVETFALMVPAVDWNPSKTAMVAGSVPFALNVASGDKLVGVDMVTTVLREYAAMIRSPALALFAVFVVCVNVFVCPAPLTPSSGAAVSTPMYAPSHATADTAPVNVHE